MIAYPRFADQFDTLYHAWKATMQQIKDANPKS